MLAVIPPALGGSVLVQRMAVIPLALGALDYNPSPHADRRGYFIWPSPPPR